MKVDTNDKEYIAFKAGYFAGNVNVRKSGESAIMDAIISKDFIKFRETQISKGLEEEKGRNR